jgi:hypothetical protein
MRTYFARRVIVSAIMVFLCALPLVRAADGQQIAQAQAASITGTPLTYDCVAAPVLIDAPPRPDAVTEPMVRRLVKFCSAIVTVNGTEVPAATTTSLVDAEVSRFDPHLALTYRPTQNWSVRGAAGTSDSFPFIGDVSGPEAIQPPAFSSSVRRVSSR